MRIGRSGRFESSGIHETGETIWTSYNLKHHIQVGSRRISGIQKTGCARICGVSRIGDDPSVEIEGRSCGGAVLKLQVPRQPWHLSIMAIRPGVPMVVGKHNGFGDTLILDTGSLMSVRRDAGRWAIVSLSEKVAPDIKYSYLSLLQLISVFRFCARYLVITKFPISHFSQSDRWSRRGNLI